MSESGCEEFRVWAKWYYVGQVMKCLCEGLENPRNIFKGILSSFPKIDNNNEAVVQGFRVRITALQPNSLISARFLSKNATVLVISDSVFVHSDLKLEHMYYGLETLAKP